eukprot:gene51210-62619_t
MSVLVVSTGLGSPKAKSLLLAREAERVLLADGTPATFLDLRELTLPLCGTSESFSHANTARGLELVAAADAILVCTPIYNYDANAVTGNTYYWIMVRGYNHVLEYNSVEGKTTIGASIVYDMPEGSATKTTARNHLFRFNYMGPRTVIGSNGYEGIRAGVSSQQGYNLASTFEFNYFYRTIYGSGEPEAVSNKSSNNTYRYNTFREVRGQITLRHGDGCTVEGNFFF